MTYGKKLITLELLTGFTSYNNRRAARERGFPAPSAGKRPEVLITYGGRTEADTLQYIRTSFVLRLGLIYLYSAI